MASVQRPDNQMHTQGPIDPKWVRDLTVAEYARRHKEQRAREAFDARDDVGYVSPFRRQHPSVTQTVRDFKRQPRG